ncbi:MAG: amidase, partial [Lentisphaeria bacterium]|nr:amidase [Lentisphaeria bacterium]
MIFRRIAALILCLYIGFSLLPPVTATEEVTVDKETLLSGLFEADIATVREAIAEGLITSEELTQYYLDRIGQYNKNYNCFITICDDALEVARQRDAKIQKGEGDGLLFGVPIVIKDNIDLAGYHTTNGHKKDDSQIKDENAAVVQSLIDEGAVIIAKTNMSTDARNAQWSYSEIKGETKNAYNHHLSAGGSSG